MWTRFMDMYSGGGSKEPQHYILIEAPEAEAISIFYGRFGHNPERVSCTCCGQDYSIDSAESLAQLTGYDRGCRNLKTPQDPVTGRYLNDDPVLRNHYYLEEGETPPEGYEVDNLPRWNKYLTLDEYLQREDVLVIRANEVKDEWRHLQPPLEGYVWV